MQVVHNRTCFTILVGQIIGFNMKKQTEMRRSEGRQEDERKRGGRSKKTQRAPQEVARDRQQHLHKGVMDVRALAHPRGEHFDRIYQAVEIVNSVQSFYRLALHPEVDLLSVESKEISEEYLRTRIRKRYPNKLVLALTEESYRGGGLIDEAPGCALICCANWEGDDEGRGEEGNRYHHAPAMRIYIVYQITSALISFAACLTAEENENMQHDDPQVGCLFDYWEEAKQLHLRAVCV